MDYEELIKHFLQAYGRSDADALGDTLAEIRGRKKFSGHLAVYEAMASQAGQALTPAGNGGLEAVHRILGLQPPLDNDDGSAANAELKRLTKLFHPDRHQQASTEDQQIAERAMKAVNAIRDRSSAQ